jgi:hypothetical protein
VLARIGEIRQGHLCLRLPRPCQQDLEIVKATQDLLCVRQVSNRPSHASGIRLDGNFKRVAELLDRDADHMKGLRGVQRAGGLDRRSELQRATNLSRFEYPFNRVRSALAVGAILFAGSARRNARSRFRSWA